MIELFKINNLGISLLFTYFICLNSAKPFKKDLIMLKKLKTDNGYFKIVQYTNAYFNVIEQIY